MKIPLRPDVLQRELDITATTLKIWVDALNKVPGVHWDNNGDEDIIFWTNLSQELALAASKCNAISALIDAGNQ